MIIDLIAGARPNFIKVAALFALAADFPSLKLRLIQTGQHSDPQMSDIFLRQLGLPPPSFHVKASANGQASQTGAIMLGYEHWIGQQRPDLTLVVGDVNSTLACALVAAKANIQVAHVEAGLRSFDRTMPEEINRILTDSISTLLFASEPAAVTNLMHEGHSAEAVHLVGQVMIDTLRRMLPDAEGLAAYQAFGVPSAAYAYLTLHRPANVDHEPSLAELCEQIIWLAARLPIIFPVHPRTRARLESSGMIKRLAVIPTLHLCEPLGYLESLSILKHAAFVVTDSGGLQEESTALGIPCLTWRANTERPITLTHGTNMLIGRNWPLFHTFVAQIMSGHYPISSVPIPYWDGKAGQRILFRLVAEA